MFVDLENTPYEKLKILRKYVSEEIRRREGQWLNKTPFSNQLKNRLKENNIISKKDFIEFMRNSSYIGTKNFGKASKEEAISYFNILIDKNYGDWKDTYDISERSKRIMKKYNVDTKKDLISFCKGDIRNKRGIGEGTEKELRTIATLIKLNQEN